MRKQNQGKKRKGIFFMKNISSRKKFCIFAGDLRQGSQQENLYLWDLI